MCTKVLREAEKQRTLGCLSYYYSYHTSNTITLFGALHDTVQNSRSDIHETLTLGPSTEPRTYEANKKK